MYKIEPFDVTFPVLTTKNMAETNPTLNSSCNTTPLPPEPYRRLWQLQQSVFQQQASLNRFLDQTRSTFFSQTAPPQHNGDSELLESWVDRQLSDFKYDILAYQAELARLRTLESDLKAERCKIWKEHGVSLIRVGPHESTHFECKSRNSQSAVLLLNVTTRRFLYGDFQVNYEDLSLRFLGEIDCPCNLSLTSATSARHEELRSFDYFDIHLIIQNSPIRGTQYSRKGLTLSGLRFGVFMNAGLAKDYHVAVPYVVYTWSDYNADGVHKWRIMMVVNGALSKLQYYNDAGRLLYDGGVVYSDDSVGILQIRGHGITYFDTASPYGKDVLPSQQHYVYEGEMYDGMRHGQGKLWDSTQTSVLLDGRWERGVFIRFSERLQLKRKKDDKNL